MSVEISMFQYNHEKNILRCNEGKRDVNMKLPMNYTSNHKAGMNFFHVDWNAMRYIDALFINYQIWAIVICLKHVVYFTCPWGREYELNQWISW